MDFLVEFGTELAMFVFLICVAVGGAVLGSKARMKKNAKNSDK